MSTNQYLSAAVGGIELINRLHQLFVDADKLMSDVSGILPHIIMDLENAMPATRADIEETIAVLQMARTKVHNVVYDFNAHYLHGASNGDGIQQLIVAAEPFTTMDSQ